VIEIALMVEGQDGLNWERWRNIARAAEDAGYVGLYRSDHFTNPQGEYKDSLECWTSLAWLASQTSRLEFGPLVSPISFRHPSMLVRIAAAVDDLSGGRLQFGIGAGWLEREHTNYSYRLGSVPERMARFGEAVHIINHLLTSTEPLTFEGKHYTLREAVLLPRPKRKVPIVIGGLGKQVTLPLVAKYADEWNTLPRPREEIKDLNSYLDTLLDKAGRPRSAVRRSVMIFLKGGLVTSTQQPVGEFVASLESAGVQRVMLNWRDDYEDVRGIAALAEHVRKALT
jgi:F420-dependent oxidoreductase-like protein